MRIHPTEMCSDGVEKDNGESLHIYIYIYLLISHHTTSHVPGLCRSRRCSSVVHSSMISTSRLWLGQPSATWCQRLTFHRPFTAFCSATPIRPCTHSSQNYITVVKMDKTTWRTTWYLNQGVTLTFDLQHLARSSVAASGYFTEKITLVVHDDDDDGYQYICRSRHKWSSDALSISRTGGPSDVKWTSMGRVS